MLQFPRFTLLAALILLASTTTIASDDLTHPDREGVRFLDRPDGRVAYEMSGPGDGPLAILIPGVGDSRHVYRFLAPELNDAGWRTISLSLRGHDESSTTFGDFSSKAVGEDVVDLINLFAADSVLLVGNSFGGPAAVWAAVECAEQVKGVVMIAPFVRGTKINPFMLALYKVALLPPWGKSAWLSVYKGNYRSGRPGDFNDYLSDLDDMLSAKGHYRAVRKTFWSSHLPALERVDEVNVPVLLVFGSHDKDFPDPAAEMRLVASMFSADTLLIDGAGHYPQAETPMQTARAVLEFIEWLP